MTYNVFGGTLNLAQSILISKLVISAGASLSQPPHHPPKDMNFSPIFWQPFLVVTLQQLRLCGPLYLTLYRFDGALLPP